MPSAARRVWVNSFVICRVHLHTIAFNEMCFVLQIPSSVFGHVRAVDFSALFLIGHLCSWGKFACWRFCWRGREILTTDSSAPVPCKDPAGLASHRHKNAPGRACQHLKLRLARIQTSLDCLNKASSILQTFWIRGETASPEEMLLLYLWLA